MKKSFLMGTSLLCTAVGCSDMGEPVGIGTEEAPIVDSVKQHAQLDFQHQFSLIGVTTATLYFTADAQPTDIEVLYFGDKTTVSGHFPMAPVSAAKISLSPLETEFHTVNLFHPAFAGNYGSVQIRLDPNGQSSSTYQTYFSTGESLYSLGGAAFNGGAYRVPYALGTTNVVMAVTNLETSPLTIEFRNLAVPSNFLSVVVQPLSTFKLDARALNWNVLGTSAVDVLGLGGTFALTAYTDRWNGARIRSYPVRLAPGLN